MNVHRFFASRNIFGDSISLHLVQRVRGENRGNFLAEKLSFRKMTEGEDAVSPSPLLTLRTEEAQQLMDELWNAGLRPSEGSGSAGSLAATQRHLEDMRALVFKSRQPKPTSDE
jgi:hypothetical protein